MTVAPIQAPHVSPREDATGCALAVRDLRVRYGGHLVLDIASLAFGTRLGVSAIIMGPNGAGKTTLLDAITGYAPVERSGAVLLGNSPISLTKLSRAQIVRHGVARSFQTASRFSSLTVAESVALASFFGRTGHATSAQDDQRDTIRDAFGLADVWQTRGRDVPDDVLRRVEIARCFACRPSVLLLDEPSAGLDGPEREWLIALLTTARHAASTPTIVLITHDLVLARRVATHSSTDVRLHILDQGHVLATGKFDEVFSRADVRRVYLGET